MSGGRCGVREYGRGSTMVWGEEEVAEELWERREGWIRSYSDRLIVGGVAVTSFQQLEASGASGEERERVGGWLLYITAHTCQVEEVRAGLASGAPVDRVGGVDSPLQATVLCSDPLPPDHPALLETATLVCLAGADPARRWRYPNGKSMVEMALDCNQFVMFHLLLLSIRDPLALEEPILQDSESADKARIA